MSEGIARVLRGSTRAHDEVAAVRELAAQIDQRDPGLVVVFCSPRFDLERLGAELSRAFPGPTIGCTTAGELSSSGLLEGSLVGASMSRDVLTAHPRLVEPVSRFDATAAAALGSELRRTRTLAPSRSFGLLFVDGLSLQEERTVAELYAEFPGMPIIGGSAGDELAFERTHVYFGGRFVRDAAVFTLVETTLPFRAFKTQHFVATSKKLVITEAQPEERRVIEIDGMPAAEAYAELLGLDVSELGPRVFSRHPVLLRVGTQWYVRSILRAEPDGSLVFYCAIDRGLVLTLAEGVDLAENLRRQLDVLHAELGRLELVVGCDCILRRLEVTERGLEREVAEILAPYPFVGFSTYGEQYNGLHVNQTLTGIALGAAKP